MDFIPKYSPITTAFTPCASCANTLNAALKNSSSPIRIRHSSGARRKTAHTLMGLSDTMGAEMENIFDHWAKVRMSDAEVKKLIDGINIKAFKNAKLIFSWCSTTFDIDPLNPLLNEKKAHLSMSFFQ